MYNEKKKSNHYEYRYEAHISHKKYKHKIYVFPCLGTSSCLDRLCLFYKHVVGFPRYFREIIYSCRFTLRTKNYLETRRELCEYWNISAKKLVCAYINNEKIFLSDRVNVGYVWMSEGLETSYLIYIDCRISSSNVRIFLTLMHKYCKLSSGCIIWIY